MDEMKFQEICGQLQESVRFAIAKILAFNEYPPESRKNTTYLFII